jgi:hypothetical protein
MIFPEASKPNCFPLVFVPLTVPNSFVFPLLLAELGAPPAPPPTIGRFAVNAAEEARVPVPEKYGIPPLVPLDRPVPPLDTARVPVQPKV